MGQVVMGRLTTGLRLLEGSFDLENCWKNAGWSPSFRVREERQKEIQKKGLAARSEIWMILPPSTKQLPGAFSGHRVNE
jgi:hypothetical protein